ncbi:MAG: C2 family cysteine protease, partial [Micrococcales bacterium]|nr:C2 family cysteine protease [Micrococcales bacterium]
MSTTKRDAGAASVEYVGIIIAVAALVVALVAVMTGVVAPDLVAKLRCTVESLGSQAPGSCGGDVDPVTYEAGDGSPSGGYQNAAPPGPVNQQTVSTALDDVRSALDGGFLGVRQGELSDAFETLKGLTPAELDAVIAQMSDAELANWVSQMEDGWFFGGWSASQRREFWEYLASTASKETLDRFAQLTSELQPRFDKVGGDSAQDDPNSVANTAAYGEVPHELFIDGADPRDVKQGAIGDCWWIASIMAVAQADPSIIESAITANANGSYTVRLYDNGQPVYVTVTPDMVLQPDGTPAFVGNGTSGGTYELWPMVLEKAMALH